MAFMIAAKSSHNIQYYLTDTGWSTDMKYAWQTEDWTEVETRFEEFERDIVKHETNHTPLMGLLKEIFPLGGKLMVVETVVKTVKMRSIR